VTINYAVGEASFPAALDDVQMRRSLVRPHAAEYTLTRCGTACMHSGRTPALMLGLIEPVKLTNPSRTPTSRAGSAVVSEGADRFVTQHERTN